MNATEEASIGIECLSMSHSRLFSRSSSIRVVGSCIPLHACLVARTPNMMRSFPICASQWPNLPNLHPLDPCGEAAEIEAILAHLAAWQARSGGPKKRLKPRQGRMSNS